MEEYRMKYLEREEEEGEKGGKERNGQRKKFSLRGLVKD